MPPDLFVIYSTAVGYVAADGAVGKRNSPFVEAFIQNMDNSADLSIVIRNMTRETLRLTNNRQRPYHEGSIISLDYCSLNPHNENKSSAQPPVTNITEQPNPIPLLMRERVIDNANLLTLEQKTDLNNIAYTIAMKYNFDLVIVTEKNIGNKTPRDYADDFFDYNGYGIGVNRDGCLFLNVIESRDYWFSTSGRGIRIFDSSSFNYSKLENDTIKYLRDGNYAVAYRSFLIHWEGILLR